MSNTHELTGTIKAIMDQQTFASGFCKREFVITTDDNYPQDVKFEVTKERCALLDNMRDGDAVNVSFRVRGNEYQGKFYVNLTAFAVEVTQKAQQTEPSPGPAVGEQLPDAADVPDDEDMPF